MNDEVTSEAGEGVHDPRTEGAPDDSGTEPLEVEPDSELIGWNDRDRGDGYDAKERR